MKPNHATVTETQFDTLDLAREALKRQVSRISMNDPGLNEIALSLSYAPLPREAVIVNLKIAFSENCFIKIIHFQEADMVTYSEVRQLLLKNKSVAEVNGAILDKASFWGLSKADVENQKTYLELRLAENSKAKLSELWAPFFQQMYQLWHEYLYDGLRTGDKDVICFFSNSKKRQHVLQAYEREEYKLNLRKQLTEQELSQLYSYQHVDLSQAKELVRRDSGTLALVNTTQEDIKCYEQQLDCVQTYSNEFEQVCTNHSRSEASKFAVMAAKRKFKQIVQQQALLEQALLLLANFKLFDSYLESHGQTLVMTPDLALLGATPDSSNVMRIPLLITVENAQLMLFSKLLDLGADPFFQVNGQQVWPIKDAILSLQDLELQLEFIKVLFAKLKQRCLEEINCNPVIAELSSEHQALEQIKHALESCTDKVEEGVKQEISWGKFDYLKEMLRFNCNKISLFPLHFKYLQQFYQLLESRPSDGDEFDQALRDMQWVEWSPSLFASPIYQELVPAFDATQKASQDRKQKVKVLEGNRHFRQENLKRMEEEHRRDQVVRELADLHIDLQRDDDYTSLKDFETQVVNNKLEVKRQIILEKDKVDVSFGDQTNRAQNVLQSEIHARESAEQKLKEAVDLLQRHGLGSQIDLFGDQAFSAPAEENDFANIKRCA